MKRYDKSPKPSSKRWIFNIRLSDAEYDQFDRVAKSLHLPLSAMMRMLVEREDQRLAGHLLTHPRISKIE